MRRSVFFLLIAAGATLALPHSSHAETYTSQDYGFSLKIPEGWESVDPKTAPVRFERMREVFDETATQSNTSKETPPTRIDYIASRGGSPATVDSPSLVVFVSEEPEGRMVNATKTLEKMKAQLTTQIEQRGETPNLRKIHIAQGLDTIGPWDIVVDRDNVETIVVFEEDWGYNMMWIKQGRRYAATLAFMVPTDQWEATAEARQTLFESFALPYDKQVKHDTARKIGYLIGACACPLLLVAALGFGIWKWKQSRDD